jgi:dTDP-4-amino-4,6-dideoxygalactose transaminase
MPQTPTTLLIPQVNLKRQYLSIKREIDEAVQSVLNSAEFIMGSAVRQFEQHLGEYLQVEHVVSCASGTDALQIAMMALGIGPGDEVITTPFTFVATAETIVLLGACPVYVDIDPKTYNIEPGQIAGRITPKSRAIIPVHLYGQPAEMGQILKIAQAKGIPVIEDAAQAIGARYNGRLVGGIGEIGCLSFFPSKNLGAFGDGGAILTRDSDLAQKCRMIRVHGSKAKYQHEILGVNSRLDTLQAAILEVKLKYLEQWTESRIRIAAQYNQAFDDLDIVTPYCAPNVRHVYNQYSVRTSRRDEFASFLKGKGIGHAIHYPFPLHQQPAFKPLLPAGASLPVAESVSKEIISLPMDPGLTAEEFDSVASSIRTFFQ